MRSGGAACVARAKAAASGAESRRERKVRRSIGGSTHQCTGIQWVRSIHQMNRRELFRHASTGAAVWTAASYSRVLGANDKVNLGVIGCGGRGSYVMSVFQKNPIVNVAAVCDV